jgi:hypothetical protein
MNVAAAQAGPSAEKPGAEEQCLHGTGSSFWGIDPCGSDPPRSLLYANNWHYLLETAAPAR